MSLTVNQCVGEIVGRTADLMEIVGLSTAVDSTNADAIAALGFGYRYLGYLPSNGLTPIDSELVQVQANQTDILLDIGEWRILSTCANRFTAVRTQVGANSAYWSDLRDGLIRRLDALTKQLKDRIGFGLTPLTGGIITLNIVETDPSEVVVIDYPGVS